MELQAIQSIMELTWILIRKGILTAEEVKEETGIDFIDKAKEFYNKE